MRKYQTGFSKYALVLAGSLFFSCGGSPSSPTDTTTTVPPTQQAATEQEGRTAIRDAVTSLMNERGLGSSMGNDVLILTNKQGKYDVKADVDTDGNGYMDLVFGMSYVTEGETKEHLAELSRTKFLEIGRNEGGTTTRDNLFTRYKDWMRDWLDIL